MRKKRLFERVESFSSERKDKKKINLYVKVIKKEAHDAHHICVYHKSFLKLSL
jgi:hypothetical protein